MNLLIAGVDEAGRGPLAGSVVAAAVILDPSKPIDGLRDSKKLTEKKRELLFDEIKAHALCYAIAEADHEEIDSLNILQASLLAMKRAVEALVIQPHKALIDGNKCPVLSIPSQAIIGGDNLEVCISAASILAKVTRDRQMLLLHEQYPEYGFATHKGYPTKLHCDAIAKYGVLPIHRKTFGPVKRYLAESLL
ncbi:MAG: rnhB [Gammaproteobacteria bacterium]|jgi:ribonuclease HII|nr:rnhB [Gammaproteobacteria bacterium]